MAPRKAIKKAFNPFGGLSAYKLVEIQPDPYTSYFTKVDIAFSNNKLICNLKLLFQPEPRYETALAAESSENYQEKKTSSQSIESFELHT